MATQDSQSEAEREPLNPDGAKLDPKEAKLDPKEAKLDPKGAKLDPKGAEKGALPDPKPRSGQKVFKKTSPNGRITVYVGQRDFLDTGMTVVEI